MKAQPSDVIERVLARLNELYGAQFTRMWEKLSPDVMKRAWARDLADFTPEEIARGLSACRDLEFPPSIPKFRALCRPEPEPEAAFYEAARIWPSRTGWSHPAIYWAALAIGNDVRRFPYMAMKARWRAAFEKALVDHQPLPEPVDRPRLEHAPVSPERLHQAAERVLGAWRRILPGEEKQL